MDENIRPALEPAPVNPYSLLEVVNRAGRSAGRAWLVFLVLAGYLALALAGVAHTHLLLNSNIALPLLQSEMALTRFFILVPLLLLAAHIGLLGQLVLTVRKILEFDSSVRLLESTDRRFHPLRMELDNFFLVQLLAGPERSRIVSTYLNGIAWLTILALPVALLLYLQIAFLPFHDPQLTLLHRTAVVADIGALMLFGVFLLQPEGNYFVALMRGAAHNPGTIILGVAVLCAAAFLSIAVATVPVGRDERNALFSAADGSLFGVFPRDIVAPDRALLTGRMVVAGRPSISLRGRDLRNARLDRSDLRQADLTGANLDGASFAGADLRGAWLECSALADAGSDRGRTQCTSARSADFTKARLDSARMEGVDLRGARLDGASLEGADLARAQMDGASLSAARLARAGMAGAALRGATFKGANLQGVDLSGAGMQLADMTGALMQGANLNRATLDGILFRSAALDGADLRAARLYGADLSGAKLRAADLSSARIWRTGPPQQDTAFVDVAHIVLEAPSESDVGFLKAAAADLNSDALKEQATARIGVLADAVSGRARPAEADALSWARLDRESDVAAAEAYKGKLSEALGDIACRAEFGDGAVASGLVRRAVREGFKGDAGALYARLVSRDCAASATVDQTALRQLATTIENARTR
jgi:uncharacterized protein YjbI with pentapeptide repeats